MRRQNEPKRETENERYDLIIIKGKPTQIMQFCVDQQKKIENKSEENE